MTIKKTTRIKKGLYAFDAYDSLDKAAIIIEGSNITIDFNNAILKGNQKQRPDEFSGVAVIVRKGKNITIKNLTAKGYKIALLAKNIEGLKIEHCDFSYNYRQRLNSSQEKEDVSDWMSYHHNEKDEWLRYGAAVYLRGCNKAVVSNCKVTGGQNALMLMECNSGLFYNNDFSFNSGIGIGMYKCSENKVLYNKLNFNVRGYSHGVYNRGQDSAGILVYEQSNNNTFYKNSVTHGGNGFFLWSGQTTMDTGEGGCNGNRIWNNDFSYAPANGIEVTFSSNHIFDNRIFDCDYGIWGGYSYNTVIANNKFRNNRIGIAIEHGQHNGIENNIFFRDKEAIRLWSKKEQPADWGYAKYRDTRSAGYVIHLNSFNQNEVVYNIKATDSIRIYNNRYSSVDQVFRIDSTVTNIDSLPVESVDTAIGYPFVKDPADPFKGNGKLAGRDKILVTAWGPYDYRYPLIWNTNPADTAGMLNFEVLGPKGKWVVDSCKGLHLPDSLFAGGASLPFAFSAKKDKYSPGGLEAEEVYIAAHFTGESFTDVFGNSVAGDKSYGFSFRKFFQPIRFTIGFFDIDTAANPVNSDYRERIKTQKPFKTETADKLDYAWSEGLKTADGLVHRQFLAVAEGKAKIAPGDYEVSITWDDAIRLYVDGKLLIDEWKLSKHVYDESSNRRISVKLGGEHIFRLEHAELGSFGALSLKMSKLY